jgi:hypothetical protein
MFEDCGPADYSAAYLVSVVFLDHCACNETVTGPVEAWDYPSERRLTSASRCHATQQGGAPKTLTRLHNCVALPRKALDSPATALARAVAPDKIGPRPMFPNLTLSLDGPGFGFFWACLPMQLGICVAFGTFFRFEQLSKPSLPAPICIRSGPFINTGVPVFCPINDFTSFSPRAPHPAGQWSVLVKHFRS